MKRTLLTLAAALAIAAGLTATKASAQTLNMDMSWGIRNLMLYQQWGDARAHQAGQAC